MIRLSWGSGPLSGPTLLYEGVVGKPVGVRVRRTRTGEGADRWAGTLLSRIPEVIQECPRWWIDARIAFFHVLATKNPLRDSGFRCSTRSTSQPFGDERYNQGVQAHPFFLGLGGELGVEAFRNPLDPFPAQSRRGSRDRIFELLCGGQPGAQRVGTVLHRRLDCFAVGDAPGELREFNQPASAFRFREAADREGVINLFYGSPRRSAQ